MPRIPNRTFKKRPKKFLGKPYFIKSTNEDQASPRPPGQDVGLESGDRVIVEPKKSTSHTKVRPNLPYYDLYKDGSGVNDIINLKDFQSLLQQIARCVKCKGPLSISAGSRFGLSVTINVQCQDCNFEVSSKNSSSLPQSKKSEINARTVYAFRSIGRGEEFAKTFCGIMNLPKPPSFKYYTSILCQAAKDVCVSSMKDAVQECVEENGGDRDLTVIFDGSWQRRGHSSLNGIVSAIGTNGKVIDVKVLTKYCRCKERLQNVHTDSCVANYAGVSGGMEVSGVLEMYRESEEKYNVRYTNYLGDGDSSSYPSVVADQPYGPDIPIEKLECVGHVQKRMGTRLRVLKKQYGKKDLLPDGKTIGGRGRLTNAVINEIQIYYGLAIRRNVNTTVDQMRTAVWATYFHLISSNEEPCHGLCPRGKSSWCKYQKAVETRTPYDHKQHTHLPVCVMELIKPIFRDLSNPELLSKCLHGGTQNASESLNNIIWSRLPKTTFIMRETLELGVYEAVASYNEGNTAKCLILKKLGISPGSNCVTAMKLADEIRIKKADKALQDIEKKCRQSRTVAKRRLEDFFEDQEDPDRPSYGTGMY